MARQAISNFFAELGFPLRPIRSAWGATNADGTVLMRAWQDERGAEGLSRVLLLGSAQDNDRAKPAGLKGRIAQLRDVWRGVAPGYVVMVTAKRVNGEIVREIEDYNDRAIYPVDRLVVESGSVFGLLGQPVPVEEFDAHRAGRMLQPNGAPLPERLREPERKEGREWSDAELSASVDAYLEMMRLDTAGQAFSKKDFYRTLSARHGRSEGSFEYRMQNISAVLLGMGRPWLTGLKPAANVGTNVLTRLRAILQARLGPIRPTKPRKRQDNMRPPKTTATVTGFVRDPAVVRWVLWRADGRCECCGEPAPFVNDLGEPFLEVHHVRQLASGGSDWITNTVGICPNCHRRLHYSADAEAWMSRLFGNVPELERE